MKKTKSIRILALWGMLLAFWVNALVLVRQPLYLVRIYQIRQPTVWDSRPDSEMKVRISHHEISYRLPLLLPLEVRGSLRKQLQGCHTDLERVIRLANWVRCQLKFGEPAPHYYVWEPRKVLVDAGRGATFVCDTYARLLACAAESFGISARVLWLDHHTVPEFYIRELQKWVLVDPPLGCYFKSGGIPLSLMELQACTENRHRVSAVVFGKKGDNPLFSPDKSVEEAVYQHTRRIFFFSGENTEVGIRHALSRKFCLPTGVQYLCSGAPNLGLRGFLFRCLFCLTGTLFISYWCLSYRWICHNQ